MDVQYLSHLQSSLPLRKVVGLCCFCQWRHGGHWQSGGSGDGSYFGQPVHLEIACCAPPGYHYMPQPGRRQHQRRMTIGKRAYHAHSSPNLRVKPFQRVVGSDVLFMFVKLK